MLSDRTTERQALAQELRAALAAYERAEDAAVEGEVARLVASDKLEAAEQRLLLITGDDAPINGKNEATRKAQLSVLTQDERNKLDRAEVDLLDFRKDLRCATQRLSTLRALVRLTVSEE